MAQVEISVNDRSYKVMCEDGQEVRLGDLAAHLDRHVADIAADLGQIGEARLLLLAALTVCDELFEARARLASLEANAAGAIADEAEAAEAIEHAAQRLTAAAERLAAA